MRSEQLFEQLLNIETIGEQYGFPKLAHYHRYEPTPYSGLEQLFAHYELLTDGRFVDMGSGKGRVPIYVHYRFGIDVIGIEMDPFYFEQAERNKVNYLRKIRKQTAPVLFYQMLVQNYEIDTRDNVFFFFNPFSIQIFRNVVTHILQSIEEYPRVVDIILYYPSQDYLQFLLYDTPFELMEEVPLQNLKDINERICVFRMI